ncbi:hypothetical protein ACOMHN_050508 [Nucella lapillus]
MSELSTHGNRTTLGGKSCPQKTPQPKGLSFPNTRLTCRRHSACHPASPRFWQLLTPMKTTGSVARNKDESVDWTCQKQLSLHRKVRTGPAGSSYPYTGKCGLDLPEAAIPTQESVDWTCRKQLSLHRKVWTGPAGSSYPCTGKCGLDLPEAAIPAQESVNWTCRNGGKAHCFSFTGLTCFT